MEKVPRWAPIALDILLVSAIMVPSTQLLFTVPVTYLGTVTVGTVGYLMRSLGQKFVC